MGAKPQTQDEAKRKNKAKDQRQTLQKAERSVDSADNVEEAQHNAKDNAELVTTDAEEVAKALERAELAFAEVVQSRR